MNTEQEYPHCECAFDWKRGKGKCDECREAYVSYEEYLASQARKAVVSDV